MVIGIIGEYIAVLFAEIKDRQFTLSGMFMRRRKRLEKMMVVEGKSNENEKLESEV